MLILDKQLHNALITGEQRYLGFGYRQLKDAACIAAQLYGSRWACKNPISIEDVHLSKQLRNLVMASIPNGHSNRDVVWQRFKQYALEYSKLSIH